MTADIAVLLIFRKMR